MAEHTEFIRSPSGDDRVMNDTLSDYLSASSDKIIRIERHSLSHDGETIHGWQVTSLVE